jgi:hypothetical protein
MPKVVRDELRCGSCGHHAFELFHETDGTVGRFGGHGSSGLQGKVIVICSRCQDESTIEAVPAAPKITSEGSLCGGWYGEREKEEDDIR